jgi:hypothetical protein
VDNTSYRLGETEIVAISAISAVSPVLGKATEFANTRDSVVRVQPDIDCFVVIGKKGEVTPVATVLTGFPMTGGVYEYINIPAGCKLAVIGAASGKLYITDASAV